MYKIIMQFIPGNDNIWVERLNPDDPIYIFDTEVEAQTKVDELTSNDPTGRVYRVVPAGA